MAVRVGVPVVRRSSGRRYGELVSAIDLVAQALDTIQALIDTADDSKREDSRWTVATTHGMRSLWHQTNDELDNLRGWARAREADLLSQEWGGRS